MMTRFRSWILPLASVLVLAAPFSAEASVIDDAARFFGLSKPAPIEDIPAPTADAPITVTASGSMAATVKLANLTAPSLPSLGLAQWPEPSVEAPLKKLFCAEYARAISGFNIFGDAKYWWERARNLYARVSTPAPHTVMVFKPSARIKKGHVAVVSAIVSKREIRVEQANWQNHGEIDHATPVLDVSARNDWSEVRVWDMKSRSFGGHVYAVSGFIAKDLVRQASRD